MGLNLLRWAALASVAGLAVLLGSCGSNSMTTIPTPIVTQIFPSNIVAGSQPFTLSVAGTLFISDNRGASVILWNGSPRSTKVNAATSELQTTITAADVAGAGIAQVTVQNPSPGGIALQSVTFTIVSPQPGLVINPPLSPSSRAAGGGAFALTVNGTGFGPNFVVTWNGSPRPTVIPPMSTTTATAQISADDIAGAGSASVAVATPGLLNATPSVNFTVSGGAAAVPAIDSLTPVSATAGSGSFQVLVRGSNFAQNAVVEWNGARLPTSFQSSSRLVVTVPDSAVSMVGTASVGVTNPGTGGTSISVPFTVR
jgi:hypothetical protein